MMNQVTIMLQVLMTLQAVLVIVATTLALILFVVHNDMLAKISIDGRSNGLVIWLGRAAAGTRTGVVVHVSPFFMMSNTIIRTKSTSYCRV